jgi:hypothetical protein
VCPEWNLPKIKPNSMIRSAFVLQLYSKFMLLLAALMRQRKRMAYPWMLGLFARIHHRMRPDAFDLALQRPFTTFAHTELEAG